MELLQTSRFRLIALIWLCSLLFLLFQGGRLSFMLFTGFSSIVLYLYLVSKSGISGTQMTRSMPLAAGERITAGTSAEVHLKFHIPGFMPIPYVLVTERLRRRRGSETTYEVSFVPDWRRRGEVRITTPPLQRGRYSFGVTSCSVEDIFGLYRYTKNIEVPMSFTVFPQKVRIKEWQDFNQMYLGRHLNSISSEVQRETTQFNGVREYIYGDPLSRIHWNASARTGTWKSKEYEKEALPRMLVVLDCAAEYKGRAHFETAVSAAASVLDYGLHSDLPVGLMTNEAAVYWAAPKRGKVHYEQLLNRLIDVEADGEMPLEQMMQTRKLELDSRLFLVFITPREDTSFLQFLRWCKMKGMQSSMLQITPEPGRQAANWQKELITSGILSYRIGALQELPAALGGGKA